MDIMLQNQIAIASIELLLKFRDDENARYEIMADLDYEYIVLIEGAMLVGRELFLKRTLPVNLEDLADCARYFDVPFTIREGGDKYMAISYIMGKPIVYLETFIYTFYKVKEQKHIYGENKERVGKYEQV